MNVDGSGDKDNCGVSTRTPTWGWMIRHNVITGAGTGIYLGNSDGSDPFVGGLIEDNLVQDPIGYCMEIKYQLGRPSVPAPDVSVVDLTFRSERELWKENHKCLDARESWSAASQVY